MTDTERRLRRLEAGAGIGNACGFTWDDLFRVFDATDPEEAATLRALHAAGDAAGIDRFLAESIARDRQAMGARP